MSGGSARRALAVWLRPGSLGSMSHDDPVPETPAVAPAVPVHSRQRMRQPEPPAPTWREFVAWPGSASMVTLLSAACLLGGLWGVLEPTMGDPSQSGDRWSVLVTVASYVACLLPAVWAMCRAQTGNPDAVAATVVATTLAVGYGLVLHLIAPEDAAGSSIAAAAGLIGLAGWWRGWLRSAGAVPSSAAFPLAAVIIWAVAWPVVLGWRTSLAITSGGGGSDVQVMAWWTTGWTVLLLILARLLTAVLGGDDPWSRRDLPFLSRPAMTWVMALVAAGCAIVALGVQAHIAGLDLLRTDLLPHVAILLLVGNELRCRAAGAHAGRDALAIAALPWVAAWLSLGSTATPENLMRGDGWGPQLVRLFTTAPGLPMGMAAVGVVLAWRRRSGGLAIGAALALSAGVLAWDPLRPMVAEALALGCLIIAAGAWRQGREDLVAAASTCAVAFAGGSRLMQEALHLRSPVATACYAGCTAAVAWAAIRPAVVSVNAAQLAGWVLGLMAAGMAWVIAVEPPRAGAWQMWSAIGLSVPLLAWCSWRRRDWAIAIAAAPASVVIAWPVLSLLIPKRRAWLGVWAAFGLLVAAVWVAVRRARKS